MKKDLEIVLTLLIGLTLISVVLYNSDTITPTVKNVLVTVLTYIKVFLVAFYFMELKASHVFWKIGISGLVIVIAIIVFIQNNGIML